MQRGIMGRSMNEYLVSLGVQVDQRGLRQMQNALRMSKITVLGLSGALAALTIGIAKASQSLTDARQKFEDMAKSSGKSADAVAKHEIALKAMGKTLAEVNKNERLKKTHEDLKKIGDEIGLPQAGVGRANLEGMMEEFQRLKVTTIYTLHHINEVFLDKLAIPLENLRKTLEEMRKNLILNMPKVSQSVGTALAIIIRLVGAGVRGFADLTKYINDLPPAIKQMLGAFAGLWAVLKASPVFWILAGLTSLLLLLDDFQTYKDGGFSYFEDIWSGMEEGNLGEVLSEKLFGGMDDLGESFAKFANIGNEIAVKVLEGLNNFDFEGAGESAGNFITKLFTKIFSFVNTRGEGSSFATTIVDILMKTTEGIGRWLVSFLNTVEWGNIGAGLGTFMSNLVSWIADQLAKIGDEGGVASTAVELVKSSIRAVGKFIVGFLSGIDWAGLEVSLGAMLESLVSWISTELSKIGDEGTLASEVVDSLLSGFGNLGTMIINLINKIDWGGLGGSVSGMLSSLVSWLADQLSKVGDEGGLATTALETVKTAVQAIGRFIIGFLDGIEWDTLGASVGGMLENFVTWISTQLSSIGDEGTLAASVVDSLLNSLNNLGTVIIDLINTVDWSGLGGSLSGMLGNLVSWVANQLAKIGEENGVAATALDLMKSAVQAIGIFIVGFLDGIPWDSLNVSIGGMLESLVSWISTQLSKVGEEGSIATSVVDSLLKSLNEVGKLILGIISKVDWGALGVSIGGMMNNLMLWVADQFGKIGQEGGLISTTITVLENGINAIGEFLVGLITEIDWGALFAGLADGGEGIMERLFEAIFGKDAVYDDNLNLISDAKPGLIKTGLDIGKKFFDAIADAIVNVDSTAAGKSSGRIVKSLFEKLGSFLSGDEFSKDRNIITGAVNLAKNLVNGILDSLAGFFSTVKPGDVSTGLAKFVESILNAITGAFKGDDEEEYKNIGQRIGEAVAKSIVFVGNVIIDLADQLLKMFNEDEAGHKLVQVGVAMAGAIMRGLSQGLRGMFFNAFGVDLNQFEANQNRGKTIGSGQVTLQDDSGTPLTGYDVNNLSPEELEQVATSYGNLEWNDFATELHNRYGLKFGYGGVERDLPGGMFSWLGIGQQKENALYDYYQKDLDIAAGVRDKGMYQRAAYALGQLGYLRGEGMRGDDLEEQLALIMQGYDADNQSAAYLANAMRGFDIGGGAYTHAGYAEKLKEFYRNLEVPVGINKEGLQSDITDAVTSMPPVGVPVVPVISGGEGGDQATGGRFSRPTRVTVSEVGQTEYIIPLNKPERAKGLILQMLSEMGSGAGDILRAFGAGGGDVSVGGIDSRLAMAGAYPAGGVGSVKSNSDNTVTSNPVINVYGSSDPVLTGKVAYEAHEQVLVRHIRGVLSS